MGRPPKKPPLSAQKPDSRSPLKTYLILALAEIINFGVFAPWLGLYHDDWFILEKYTKADSLAAAFLSFLSLMAERPLAGLHYPLLLAWGGFEGWRYQILFLILETIAAILLYRLLNRLFGHGPALTASLFALCFPSRTATHHWLSISGWNVSWTLTLASLIAHLRWLDGRGRHWLWAGFLLYLLAVLDYEAVALMPLFVAAALAVKRASQGLDWKRALALTLQEFAPFALAFIVAQAWQRWGVSFFLGSGNPRPLKISLDIIMQFARLAAACLTTRLVRLMAASWSEGWQSHPVLTLLGAFWAWGMSAYLTKSNETTAQSWRRTALAAAAVGLLAGLAPYAAAAYVPAINGLMSRTMAATGLPAGLAVAAALSSAGLWRRRALIFILLWAFVLTNWNLSRQWARSWEIQRDILKKLAAHVPEIPEGASVILVAPSHATSDRDSAPVFTAHWDIGPALRLATGRPDLEATVATREMRFENDRVIAMHNGVRGKEYPFSRSFFYFYITNRLGRPGAETAILSDGRIEGLINACRSPHPSAPAARFLR